MKKIDDRRCYFYFGIATLVLGIILAMVSFYSILVVEPEVDELLSLTENIDLNYKKAYIILRDPQVFAGYKNFDAEGISVKKSLSHFDEKIYSGKKVYSGEEIDSSVNTYLQILLDRREKGSRLGRNTMIFLLLLSLLSWLAFFHEKYKML